MVDFADLETRVKHWAENDGTEFDAEFDTMLENAEYRISRELNVDAMLLHKTTAFTISTAFLDKPSDAVNTRSLSFIDSTDSSKRKFLEFRTLTYMQDYWPLRSSTGTPLYYGNWDEDTYYVAPTPAIAEAVEVDYEARLIGLTSSNTTTYISINYPDLLFHAVLLEAGCFEKASEMFQKHQGIYDRHMVSIQAETARIRGDDPSIYENPTETPVDDDDDDE